MSTYTGHLLRVDLSSASVTREPIPLDQQRKFVGGRGFGISYLFEEMHKGIDPLGPENKLIFLPGVLAGTAALRFVR